MTKAEFLEKLRGTPRKWRLTGFTVRPIRSGYHCPITAIDEMSNGSWDVKVAARHLGLDEKLMNQIIDAADVIGNYDESLRNDLLEACGLTEAE